MCECQLWLGAWTIAPDNGCSFISASLHHQQLHNHQHQHQHQHQCVVQHHQLHQHHHHWLHHAGGRNHPLWCPHQALPRQWVGRSLFVANNLVIAIHCHAPLFLPISVLLACPVNTTHSWQLQGPCQLWAEPRHKNKMRFGANLAQQAFLNVGRKWDPGWKSWTVATFLSIIYDCLYHCCFPLKFVFLCLWIFIGPARAVTIFQLYLLKPPPILPPSPSSMNGDAAKTRQNNFLSVLSSTSHCPGCLGFRSPLHCDHHPIKMIMMILITP